MRSDESFRAGCPAQRCLPHRRCRLAHPFRGGWTEMLLVTKGACRPSASPLPVSASPAMDASSSARLPRQAPFMRGACLRCFAYQNWLAAPRTPLASRGPQRHLRPGWRHDWCAARSAPSRLFGQVLRALYRQCAVADNLTLSPGGVPSNTCSCNQSGGAAAHPSLAQEIRE